MSRQERVSIQLDAKLSKARKYPAINISTSFSYNSRIHNCEKLLKAISRTTSILQHGQDLQEIVELVGVDSLEDKDSFLLYVVRLVKENFMQQPLQPSEWLPLLNLFLNILDCGEDLLRFPSFTVHTIINNFRETISMIEDLKWADVNGSAWQEQISCIQNSITKTNARLQEIGAEYNQIQ